MRLITVKSLFNEVSRDFGRNEMCERFRVRADALLSMHSTSFVCYLAGNPRDDVIVAIYSNREQARRRDFP